jgi:hypothetical protein
VSMRVLSGWFVLVALLLLATPARAQSSQTRRLAVVVGANEAAPGRQKLRYAHTDAQLMADVLVRVGRFAKADVQVLLEPSPAEVLAAIERAGQSAKASNGDSLLVFYYSGHSDGQQVFPRGESLALAALRDRVAKTGARVRVGILDTCRGGDWTRTKGLSVGPPLDPVDLMNVATEGTALLSSSSGIENAHEADAVRGSFFTHHVAAGLLGAADKSGDGNVTLQEVFEYARERTVRDSARLAATPQHPSFDVQLRGRQDVILAQLKTSPSALALSQTNGLEVIHLGTGVTVVETPPGKKQFRLALLPGRYLVRRVTDGRVYSKELEIRAGQTASLSEDNLVLSGSERLAMKDATADERPYAAHSTPPKRWWELRLALGATAGPRRYGSLYVPPEGAREPQLERDLDGAFALTYGITDRLAWSVPVPAFSYRIGNHGAFEIIPRAGLVSIGYSSLEGVIGSLDGGVATRAWVTPRLSLVANGSVGWGFRGRQWAIRDTASQTVWARADTLNMSASGGALWSVHDAVTLHFGLGWSGRAVLAQPEVAGVDPADIVTTRPSSALVLGAVQELGYRPLPLLQVHLSRRFSLDGYASWAVDLQSGDLHDRYLAGFTWAF